MLALDTGIKRSQELLTKFSFVKSPIWGFSPLILLLIFGGLSIYNHFVSPKEVTGIASLSPPRPQTTAPQSVPTPYQYRNELSVPALMKLIQQLHGTFTQNQPLTFVITAPPEGEQFKDDFYAVVVAACQWRESASLCTIEPAPDPRLVIDTGIPAPRFPGIVVHSADSMPNLLGTMLTMWLRDVFTVHKSGQIPNAIKRLDPNKNDQNLVWFELGSGSPWR